jgi:hypothetical protein
MPKKERGRMKRYILMGILAGATCLGMQEDPNKDIPEGKIQALKQNNALMQVLEKHYKQSEKVVPKTTTENNTNTNKKTDLTKMSIPLLLLELRTHYEKHAGEDEQMKELIQALEHKLTQPNESAQTTSRQGWFSWLWRS